MEDWNALAVEWVQGRVRRREIVPSTGRNHICALNSFLVIVGNARTIRRDHVDRWLETTGNVESTIRSDFSAIRGWCQWLAYERKITRDPTFGRKAPKEPERLPRYLELEQVAQVFEACPDRRLFAICWLMYGAGLRCAEVAGITMGNWDRKNRTVRVIGKGNKQREAAVPNLSLAAVEAYLCEHPATVGPLFRSYKHPTRALTSDTISGLVSKAMDDAGIKGGPRDGVSAHAFRHSCASDMLEASDGDLWLVAEQLGHKNLQTLRVYLRRARSDETRAAMERRLYPAQEAAVVELDAHRRRAGERKAA